MGTKVEHVQAWTANRGHNPKLTVQAVEDFQKKFNGHLILMRTRNGGFGVVADNETTAATLRALISEHCPKLRSARGAMNQIF